MNITITFRHMASSDALKDYVHDKFERVQKYLRQPADAHVTLYEKTNGAVGSTVFQLGEEGHFLGLDHSSQPSAVMYASYPGGLKRTLTSDDIAGVCFLYPTGVAVPDAGVTTHAVACSTGRTVAAQASQSSSAGGTQVASASAVITSW